MHLLKTSKSSIFSTEKWFYPSKGSIHQVIHSFNHSFIQKGCSFIKKKQLFIKNVHSKRMHRWPTWPCSPQKTICLHKFSNLSSLLYWDLSLFWTIRCFHLLICFICWWFFLFVYLFFHFFFSSNVAPLLEPIPYCTSETVTFYKER